MFTVHMRSFPIGNVIHVEKMTNVIQSCLYMLGPKSIHVHVLPGNCGSLSHAFLDRIKPTHISSSPNGTFVNPCTKIINDFFFILNIFIM